MRAQHVNNIPMNILRFAVGIAFVFALQGSSFGQDSNGSKTVDGMIAYYGVVPSQVISTHPAGHTEAKMHGGVPGGKYSYHIVVALFDRDSFERITDAEVSARVAEAGLTGRTKPLEPMMINEAMTYGNYFKFSPHTLYRITVSVRIANKPEAKFEFDYKLG